MVQLRTGRETTLPEESAEPTSLHVRRRRKPVDPTYVDKKSPTIQEEVQLENGETEKLERTQTSRSSRWKGKQRDPLYLNSTVHRTFLVERKLTTAEEEEREICNSAW